MSAEMAALNHRSNDSFPGWPSGDFKGILQLKEPLANARARLGFTSHDEQPRVTSDDDNDGLGPYSGFHFKDKEIGYVVFVSHLKSPIKGTDVIVDAKVPLNEAINRLRELLHLKQADIKWVHPGAKLASSQEKPDVSRPLMSSPKHAAPTIPLSKVAAELAEKTGMTKKAANTTLDEFVGVVVKHLKRQKKVRITGLGILQVRSHAARMGRNPATGEAIKIKASKKVAFRVAKDLKDAI